MASGRFENAQKQYAELAKAQWPDYKMRASTSMGRSLQAQNKHAEAEAAFNDLASGVVSLRAILYFISVTAVFLYVNLILLARRHTERGEAWFHFSARALSILIIGISRRSGSCGSSWAGEG